MPNIERVSALDGDMLDIELSNGNILLLSVKLLLEDPRFARLAEDDRVLYPKTDGAGVYWRDGPRLEVDELMRITFRQN